MADKGTAAPADLELHHGSKPGTSPADSYFAMSGPPRALRQALRTAGSGSIATPSESSEEDYDDESRKPVAVLLRRRKGQENAPSLPRSGSNLKTSAAGSGVATPSDGSSEAGHLEDVTALKGAKVYTIASDDKELRDILRRGMNRVSIVIKVRAFSENGRLTLFRPKMYRPRRNGKESSVITFSRGSSPRSTGRTKSLPTVHSMVSSPCSGSRFASS